MAAGIEEWGEMVSQLWDAWPLRIDVCPCDLHFVEFVEEQRLAQATIFHMGTGAHHLVGRRLAHDGRSNVVLGITIAPREHEEYVKLAMADPVLARSYQVLLGDIYLMNGRLLPDLDVVTLFHLGEYQREEHAAHAWSDIEVIDLLLGKLHPGGWLILYAGSVAFAAASAAAAEVVERGRLEAAGTYRSLVLFRKSR
jgi:hypothetical protein